MARADENKLFTPDYFRRVGRDVVGLPRAIANWGPKEWTIAGGVALATYGVYTYDSETRDNFGVKRKDFFSDVSQNFTHFGDVHLLLPIIAGTWITGAVTGSTVLTKTAGDTAESALIAAGIINPALAFATGRALPSKQEDPKRFLPFRRGRYSFPSGHTSAAFAVASAIDVDFRETFGYWHTPVVYGVATMVGMSRVYDHKHYPSEVLLGAAIGTSVGRWVSTRKRNQSNVSAFITPNSVQIAWKFGPGTRHSDSRETAVLP